jgi:hypothetical protein
LRDAVVGNISLSAFQKTPRYMPGLTVFSQPPHDETESPARIALSGESRLFGSSPKKYRRN